MGGREPFAKGRSKPLPCLGRHVTKNVRICDVICGLVDLPAWNSGCVTDYIPFIASPALGDRTIVSLKYIASPFSFQKRVKKVEIRAFQTRLVTLPSSAIFFSPER